MTTIIRTARLEMRPLQTGDTERVFALFSDPDVLRWMTAPPSPYTYADAHGFVAEKAAVAHDLRQTAYAITHDGALIGAIDVHDRIDTPDGAPVLGYWIGKPCWGNGYVTEAARGFLAHVFAAGVGDVVRSGAFAGNGASLRVQEKLGFTRAGERMVFSKPQNAMLPFVDTVVGREGFLSPSS